MKLLLIPATNSRAGINRQLLQYVERRVHAGLLPGATVELVDLNDYELPIYSVERQAESGVPQLAKDLFTKIGEADAVVVSFAEHNGSYSAAWKNIYDWMSRHDMGVYQGRKVAMLATAPGPRGGSGVLETASRAAPFFGGELVGSLSVPSFFENFDPERGELTNVELSNQLDAILVALAA